MDVLEERDVDGISSDTAGPGKQRRKDQIAAMMEVVINC
jgi:hypothetical protein